jgi:hypothetical protein
MIVTLVALVICSQCDTETEYTWIWNFFQVHLSGRPKGVRLRVTFFFFFDFEGIYLQVCSKVAYTID